MYPNPLNNSGTIRFNIELKNFNVTIYDVCGKKLNIVKEIYDKEVKIERNYLSSGVYFVILSQENNPISISRLIVFD